MTGHIADCFDADGTRVCGFDEHPESVPAPASSEPGVLCRRRLFGGERCGIPLRVGWSPDYYIHTRPPAHPHYPRPAKP